MAEPVFVGLPRKLVGVTIDGRDIEMTEGNWRSTRRPCASSTP